MILDPNAIGCADPDHALRKVRGRRPASADRLVDGKGVGVPGRICQRCYGARHRELAAVHGSRPLDANVTHTRLGVPDLFPALESLDVLPPVAVCGLIRRLWGTPAAADVFTFEAGGGS